jgi:NAD(P)-dependent dehydrogenase (short-subunit alcohol dehydrogenase family)
VVSDAVAHLGGLDALVFAAALDPMIRIEDAHAQTWAATFAVNVTGATLVTRAALPHLTESRGKAVYLSSIAGPASPPLPGLGVYGVSKAALERLVDSWPTEHPQVGFTRLILGPTGTDPLAPSEFGRSWDLDLATEMIGKWTGADYLRGAISHQDLTQTIVTIHSPSCGRAAESRRRAAGRSASWKPRTRRGGRASSAVTGASAGFRFTW